MKQYLDLVQHIFEHGELKGNRTHIPTLSVFNYNYEIDLQEGFPLLTTKDMSGYVWESLVHELLWYLSGEHHIRDLRGKTGIWDNWADDNGNLHTAYGRFWRRYPVPSRSQRLHGEAWKATPDPIFGGETPHTVDQIQYIIDTLRNEPSSRRMVLTAWHPANAMESRLPPCHLMAIFNVSHGKLCCHLTQRSGDVGLGVPFNIASYSLLTHLLANTVGLEVGKFAHTIVDAHIYAGRGKSWEERIEDEYSHVKALTEQLNRSPRPLPTIDINGGVSSGLRIQDIDLIGYNPHPRIKMKVAP